MSPKDLLKNNALIEKAFNFAKKAHNGQKRKSGEPYFNHCYETALQLTQWQMDPKTIAAGLLHDVVEDTNIPLETIKKEFGEEIAFLVNGVTKLGHFKYRPGITKEIAESLHQAENLRKLILALSQDIRVIIIKLADRLHNMKTLAAVPAAKQKRIASETAEIYAPLAYRLGMANLAGELEDLSFPYIHPKEYRWLIENVREKYEEREKYLLKVKSILEKNLKENKIEPVKIDFRAKRYFSLYKKLLQQNMNLDQIYDLMALRIIVNSIEECYHVLGIVHQLWPPMPGRIKDYIAMPKPNGYRSLHTTVICLDDKPTEIQIRTAQMHQESENGIAAHWAYHETKGAQKNKKENKKEISFADKKELAWVEQLRRWQEEFSPTSANSQEFLQSLKIDFFKDRIFAITPKGEVIDLPVGATPIDFAYAIHTEVGDSAVAVKVNAKIAPLNNPLQSGDLVEILTQKSKKPSRDWLTFVKTSSAKEKIKHSLRGKKEMGKIGKESITEIKIAASDRIGLLKDILAIFSNNHINIQSTNTQPNGNYQIIKIRTNATKEKIEKLIIKLKKIKEIKEIILY